MNYVRNHTQKFHTACSLKAPGKGKAICWRQYFWKL